MSLVTPVAHLGWEELFLRSQWLPYASALDGKNIPKLVRTCLDSEPPQRAVYETTISSLQTLQINQYEKCRREEAEARFGIYFSKLLRTGCSDYILELFAKTIISLEQRYSDTSEMNSFCNACYDFSYDKQDEGVISDFCAYCVELKEEGLPIDRFISAYKDYAEKGRISFDVDTTFEIRRGAQQGELRQVYEIYKQREIDLRITQENERSASRRKHIIFLIFETAAGILKLAW